MQQYETQQSDANTQTNAQTHVSIMDRNQYCHTVPELILIANCNCWEIQLIGEGDVDANGFLMPTKPEYVHYDNVDQNRCSRQYSQGPK